MPSQFIQACGAQAGDLWHDDERRWGRRCRASCSVSRWWRWSKRCNR